MWCLCSRKNWKTVILHKIIIKKLKSREVVEIEFLIISCKGCNFSVPKRRIEKHFLTEDHSIEKRYVDWAWIIFLVLSAVMFFIEKKLLRPVFPFHFKERIIFTHLNLISVKFSSSLSLTLLFLTNLFFRSNLPLAILFKSYPTLSFRSISVSFDKIGKFKKFLVKKILQVN